MKKQKVITLIALVITIVIILILAGISINAVCGNNGILTSSSDTALNVEENELECTTEVPKNGYIGASHM
jgi:hypothetical protein